MERKKCSRCATWKGLEDFDTTFTKEYYKVCMACQINKIGYKIKVMRVMGEQLRNRIRIDGMIQIKDIFDKYSCGNYLFDLPTDIFHYILTFVYGDNSVLISQFKCELCGKVLTKSNKSRHKKVCKKRIQN